MSATKTKKYLKDQIEKQIEKLESERINTIMGSLNRRILKRIRLQLEKLYVQLPTVTSVSERITFYKKLVRKYNSAGRKLIALYWKYKKIDQKRAELDKHATFFEKVISKLEKER